MALKIEVVQKRVFISFKAGLYIGIGTPGGQPPFRNSAAVLLLSFGQTHRVL